MAGKVSSVKEYFDTLDERFVQEGSKGVTAVYQFELSGDDGGTYHVSVDDGTMAVHEGSHEKPTATLKIRRPTTSR